MSYTDGSRSIYDTRYSSTGLRTAVAEVNFLPISIAQEVAPKFVKLSLHVSIWTTMRPGAIEFIIGAVAGSLKVMD